MFNMVKHWAVVVVGKVLFRLKCLCMECKYCSRCKCKLTLARHFSFLLSAVSTEKKMKRKLFRNFQGYL